MTDDAWSNFIAAINPDVLESERMRVHGDLDHERPGSRWDHEMRHAHEWLKQQRIRAAVDEDMAGEIRRLQLADADAQIWHLRHTNPNNIDQDALDAALDAYRARKAAA